MVLLRPFEFVGFGRLYGLQQCIAKSAQCSSQRRGETLCEKGEMKCIVVGVGYGAMCLSVIASGCEAIQKVGSGLDVVFSRLKVELDV